MIGAVLAPVPHPLDRGNSEPQRAKHEDGSPKDPVSRFGQFGIKAAPDREPEDHGYKDLSSSVVTLSLIHI